MLKGGGYVKGDEKRVSKGWRCVRGSVRGGVERGVLVMLCASDGVC